MLAARKAGVPSLPPASPPPLSGPCILEGTPAAGQLFPQALANLDGKTARLDDALGAGAWLISSGPAPSTPDVTTVGLDDPRLTPFKDRISGWLASQKVEAVLVRPDRYVFGSGAPDQLLKAWSGALRCAA